MRLNHSSFRSLFTVIANIISLRRLKGFRRQLVAITLMFALLALPGQTSAFSSALTFAANAFDTALLPIRFAPSIFARWFAAKPSTPPQSRNETFAERAAAVSRLQISPLKFVAYQGQTLNFTALPMDAQDRVIQGVRISWESSDAEKVQVSDSGNVTFLQPGLARVVCRVGAVQSGAFVLVRPGARPQQTDEQWRADQSTLRVNGTVGSATRTGKLLPNLLNRIAPTAEAQGPVQYELLYDSLWNDPRNLVGSPNNRAAEATKIGSVLPEGSNANVAIPIVGLGGRGIGSSLTLFYNSRIWARRDNNVGYLDTGSSPSPGFSLGFGRLVTYGYHYWDQTIKLMWVEPDGTRRYLGSGSVSGNWSVQTSDGSDISYNGNLTYGGTLRYPSGVAIGIQAVGNLLLPTLILDPNGNYVSITYKSETCEPSCSECSCVLEWPAGLIDYVTDTKGRVITFNYDYNYGAVKLLSIAVPAAGGTSQNPLYTDVVKFDYQWQSVTTNFSGLTVEAGLNSFNGLRHVFFPATGSGYRFTYSGYGMIYNFSLRKDMYFYNGIQSGTERANVSFNYPTSGSTQLTDAPAFTERSETALNATSATYSYATSTNGLAQTKTFTITQPDSSQLLLTRSTNTSSAANGLLIQIEVQKNSVTYTKAVSTYVNTANAPRVQTVTAYDDTGTPNKADFDYDSYGNVTNKREYGQQISGQWQVRRRTRTTYKTDTAYLNVGLKSLPMVVEVYDAKVNTNDNDDEAIAKTSFTYDDYQAMSGMEIYPNQPEAPGHLSNYDNTVTVRGNVTGTIQWYDLTNNLSITRLKKIDKYGNVVKEQTSCCNVRSYTCSEATC